MITIDIDDVFEDGGEVITIVTNRAMGNAIQNLFSQTIVYVSSGETAIPTESQSELIESGIADISTALNP